MTLTCCRRSRWWWQWPRDPPSSPRPTPPRSPTLTTTSPPPRTGPGLAEPARLGPSASLRDIPLARQPAGPCWAGSPKGLSGYPPPHPRVPQLCTSPRGSNKPESRGHCCGCCPDSWWGKRDHRGGRARARRWTGRGWGRSGGPCGVVSPGQAMRDELGPPAHPPAHRSARSGTGAAQRGGGVANGLNHAHVPAHRRHWPRPNRLPAGRRARGAANQRRAWFSNRRRAGGGAGNQAREQPQPPRSPHQERAHTESHRSRSRDQEQERGRAMERPKTPAVSAGRGSVWMFRWGQPRGGF